jgi:hypothetical protein
MKQWIVRKHHTRISLLQFQPLFSESIYVPSRDSSVGIVKGYWLESRGVEGSTPAGVRDFPLLHSVQDGLWNPPRLIQSGQEGFFAPVVKRRGVKISI